MTEASAGYRCPMCRAAVPSTGVWRPFCSERCKMVDLGAWMLGHYRIPAEPDPDDDLGSAPLPPPALDDDDDASS